MRETPIIEQVCPYLRGRNTLDPLLSPTADNVCRLASSIHLPESQQSDFCLNGAFVTCTRYQRQQGRPIPRHVRGAKPLNIRPFTPTIPTKTLVWRQPWARSAAKWVLVMLFLFAFLALWRMRMNDIPPLRIERVAIPTPVISATPTPPSLYLPPTEGPPEW